MATYLENYLQSISTLPVELSRNFALIRELDENSHELSEKVESLMSACQSIDPRNLDHALTEEVIVSLRNNLQTCVTLGNEKVSLATQTYELVDKHIRRLDQDLKKFANELESHHMNTPLKKKYSVRGLPVAALQNSYQPFQAGVTTARPYSTPVTSRLRKNSVQSNEFVNKFEMPVDPNEPKYCLCNRVSSGNMVGCDNNDCPIEWFHFECVGLTGPFKGYWLCPVCREKDGNKRA